MKSEDAVKRIRFWVSLGLAVLTAGTVAGWTVAGKVYALENKQAVQQTTIEFMAKQIDWLTSTAWQGRPTTPPPERK